jgi:hypothetical protein
MHVFQVLNSFRRYGRISDAPTHAVGALNALAVPGTPEVEAVGEVPTVRPPTKRASKAFLSDMLQHGRVPATTLEAARAARLVGFNLKMLKDNWSSSIGIGGRHHVVRARTQRNDASG